METPENHDESRKWAYIKLTVILLYITFIASLNVFSSGTELNVDLSNPDTINFWKFGQAVSVILMFVLPPFMFFLFWTTEKLYYPGLHKFPSVTALFLSVFAIFAALPAIGWTEKLNKMINFPDGSVENWMKSSEEKLGVLTEAFLATTTVEGLLINLFVIAFLAAFSEELFFRGLLQKVVGEFTKNIHVAVWLTAAIFSAFHLQFFGFIPRMLLGAMLGYLFVWSGSLWLPIIVHFLNNGMAVTMTWLFKSGKIKVDPQTIGTGENETVMGITSLLVTLLLMVVIRKKLSATAPATSC